MSAAPSRLAIQRASRASHIPSDARLRRWARAALPAAATVTLRFVAEAEGRRLNREFRRKDYATTGAHITTSPAKGAAPYTKVSTLVA